MAEREMTAEEIHALGRVLDGLVTWDGDGYDIGDAIDTLNSIPDTAVQAIFARHLQAGLIEFENPGLGQLGLTDAGLRAFVSGRV